MTFGQRRWLSGLKYLTPSLMTWDQSLRPAWLVETTDSQRLSPSHVCCDMHTHTLYVCVRARASVIKIQNNIHWYYFKPYPHKIF